MKSSYAIALAALLAAAPAMGQVVIQTPGTDSGLHEQRANQERSEARQERREAESRAAVGDYEGAAQADREARRDWRSARRQDERAQSESGGTVIIGH